MTIFSPFGGLILPTKSHCSYLLSDPFGKFVHLLLQLCLFVCKKLPIIRCRLCNSSLQSEAPGHSLKGILQFFASSLMLAQPPDFYAILMANCSAPWSWVFLGPRRLLLNTFYFSLFLKVLLYCMMHLLLDAWSVALTDSSTFHYDAKAKGKKRKANWKGTLKRRGGHVIHLYLKPRLGPHIRIFVSNFVLRFTYIFQALYVGT